MHACTAGTQSASRVQATALLPAAAIRPPCTSSSHMDADEQHRIAVLVERICSKRNPALDGGLLAQIKALCKQGGDPRVIAAWQALWGQLRAPHSQVRWRQAAGCGRLLACLSAPTPFYATAVVYVLSSRKASSCGTAALPLLDACLPWDSPRLPPACCYPCSLLPPDSAAGPPGLRAAVPAQPSLPPRPAGQADAGKAPLPGTSAMQPPAASSRLRCRRQCKLPGTHQPALPYAHPVSSSSHFCEVPGGCAGGDQRPAAAAAARCGHLPSGEGFGSGGGVGGAVGRQVQAGKALLLMLMLVLQGIAAPELAPLAAAMA